MDNRVPDFLPRLERHRLAGLDAGPGAFYPHYQGYSLANLPASVCGWLGAPPLGAPPLAAEITRPFAGPFRQVVLLLVDGLGLDRVEGALARGPVDDLGAAWQSIGQGGSLTPLTSIAPSTTAAALATLWTGAPPSEHGVFAYEVWLKEYGLIANMILHAPASFTGEAGSLSRAGFSPENFLPVPTLGPHLRAHGVRPLAFQHQSIAHSGLSRMLLPGVDVTPFRTQSDLWVTLGQAMDEPTAERRYLYAYWGDLDDVMHRYGPHDERTHLEFTMFSRQLDRFLKARKAAGRGDTLIIVTADHGHNDTPRRADFEVRNHPELLDCLVMRPSGEGRLPVVYLRPGREEDFRRAVERAWPGVFRILSSQAAVRAGLFGETVYDRFWDRVGDLLVVPQEEGAYWWFGSKDNLLLGRHGGLSRREMLIPLMTYIV